MRELIGSIQVFFLRGRWWINRYQRNSNPLINISQLVVHDLEEEEEVEEEDCRRTVLLLLQVVLWPAHVVNIQYSVKQSVSFV